jgi:hypothetical protein
MSRLIDLVAEDNAIEDTIYHMTRALDNERIDLDRYMKVFLPVPSISAQLITLGNPKSGKRTVHETSPHRAYTPRHGSDATTKLLLSVSLA